ncbi:MAG: hypothetical protein JNJ56_13350 [Ignavibacteria bacterium]|nr:hypothetical protein [Ignavibacteria bacterium]
MKKIIPVSMFICLLITLTSLSVINDRVQAQDMPPLDDSISTVETPGVDSIFIPGNGFDIVKGKQGSLNFGAYGLFRYINQLPSSQSYVDHLGNTRNIDTRNDFQLQRVMIFFRGFFLNPKFNYNLTIWTVNATNQIAIIGNLSYKFAKQFNLYAGWGALPGTRSNHYSHPFWLAPDRIMADEYFRPYFTQGIWADGEILPGVLYTAMIGNNSSNLDVSAANLTRSLASSASIDWRPTTGEFGKYSSFSDYDEHKKLATTIGTAFTHSRENRFTQDIKNSPNNTGIRLSDALNLFETGALAKDVTVIDADYNMVSANLGFKYKGFFLQTEWYSRTLNKFNTDGPVPLSSMLDQGFYVAASYMAIPKWVELYCYGSQVWGQFNNSNEITSGVNVYPYGKWYLKLNAQVIVVNRSNVSSTFGYYVGGLKGTILSLAASFFL